jgi:hypothetical protein
LFIASAIIWWGDCNAPEKRHASAWSFHSPPLKLLNLVRPPPPGPRQGKCDTDPPPSSPTGSGEMHCRTPNTCCNMRTPMVCISPSGSTLFTDFSWRPLTKTVPPATSSLLPGDAHRVALLFGRSRQPL